VAESEAASEVCVSFRLSRPEFEAAMHRMFWALWQMSMTLYAGVLLLVVGVIVTVVGWQDTMPLFALALVWFAAAAWIYWVSPRRQFRARQRASAEQTHCFSDSGSTAHFIDAETRMAWSLYGEIRETREAYLLRLENRAVNIIPKRAFTSSGDEATFRDLAQRHTKVKISAEPGYGVAGRGRTPSSSNP
jgi:YcxB-like protein